jgi:RNA-binding protein
MRTLTPAERRAFRAKAHPLHPFVIIGQHGITAAVLHEIDVNLLAHELIKIRVLGDDRDEREALLLRICAELDAAPVQHLGKVLTIWRPSPEPPAAAPKSRAKVKARAGKPPRPKPRGEQRTPSDGERPSARKPAPSRVEWQRRKPEPRGGAAVKVRDARADPGARRRKPGSRDGTTLPFAAEPGTRRRKPGARSGTTPTFTAEPGARRRKPGPRGGSAAAFAADPAARRRRTKR